MGSPGKEASSDTQAPTLNTRAIALDVLGAILARNRPLDEALAANAGWSSGQLSSRDSGMVRMLVTTTLRRLGQIDGLLDSYLDRPLPQPENVVRNILRIGVAQILFMRVAEHAAVDRTVDLCGIKNKDKYRALVNAILRRIIREADESGSTELPDPITNLPDWLRSAWIKAYGSETTALLAEAHLQEPPLDITVKEGGSTWAQKLGGLLLPTGSIRLSDHRGGVTDLPGYREGAWWVQDVAATLPVRLLGPVAGKHIIDLCAAPGGKTLELAALGARVTAVDRSKPRLRRMQENLDRTGLSANLVQADATQWNPDFTPDAILVDAPCSATGTLRRHPDIPWIKSSADLTQLRNLQTRLLDAAITMAPSGAPIVYCTCSLEPEEGPDQISALRERNPGVRLEAIDPTWLTGAEECLNADGTLRTLPTHLAGRGGMDGFFAARLVKD